MAVSRERRRRRLSRWWWLLFLAIGGAAVAVGLILFTDVLPAQGGGTLTGSASDPVRIEYPEGWRPLTAEQLIAFDNAPVAVLQHEDGKGIIVVQRQKPFAGNLQRFARDLREELDRRIADFRESSVRVIRTQAGNAFYYSYVRTRRGTVHIIIVVPAGDRSYVMNAVVSGGTDDAARDTGRIISSFDLEGR